LLHDAGLMVNPTKLIRVFKKEERGGGRVSKNRYGKEKKKGCEGLQGKLGGRFGEVGTDRRFTTQRRKEGVPVSGQASWLLRKTLGADTHAGKWPVK